ncbi:hypothetical protein LCGC14_1103910 [marine sediment metagenome]|uniref:Uncharacterized protein n=1 Tax=marine sediment metagenome TaxID=412755 RepID=A0A0F9QEZ0_9ZZZZ
MRPLAGGLLLLLALAAWRGYLYLTHFHVLRRGPSVRLDTGIVVRWRPSSARRSTDGPVKRRNGSSSVNREAGQTL